MTQPFSFGVVVLTMGKRPEELAVALESLLVQVDVTLDVVVVVNGDAPVEAPEGVKFITLTRTSASPQAEMPGCHTSTVSSSSSSTTIHGSRRAPSCPNAHGECGATIRSG